ncbi:MAG: CsgG/HfaB family protein [Spirochaetota bacterium]|nr:CsgG/HfaB family protein [Spirochaetota bacterium]
MRKLTVLITMLVGVMFNVVANENMSQGKKVAVLPFAVKGNFDTLYAEVALDNFTTELIKSNTYKIVERPQLDKAMKDLKFQSGSAIDESVAMEIGKNTGAKIVVIGEITALMGQIAVNIRGINVDSGIIEFADKGIINSQDELLVAIERIAKKFFGSENFVTQNYVNQSPAMDFSINTEYTEYINKKNAERAERKIKREEKIIAKYFEGKWKIDPKDTPKVYEVYKKFLYTGVGLSVAGGITALTGLIMSIAGICSMTMTMGGLEIIPLVVIGTIAWLSGAALLGVSSVPFSMASRIKKIHTRLTGEKSFTPRVSTTGGFNGENKLEIALGYRF